MGTMRLLYGVGVVAIGVGDSYCAATSATRYRAVREGVVVGVFSNLLGGGE